MPTPKGANEALFPRDQRRTPPASWGLRMTTTSPDLFAAALRVVYERVSATLPTTVVVNKQELDLFGLFKAVAALGGWQAVTLKRCAYCFMFTCGVWPAVHSGWEATPATLGPQPRKARRHQRWSLPHGVGLSSGWTLAGTPLCMVPATCRSRMAPSGRAAGSCLPRRTT